MEKESLVFTTSEVEKEFGVQRNCLKEWISLGHIEPKIKAEGHGSKHILDIKNLVDILVMKKLIRIGLRREAAANLINIGEKCQK